MAWGAGGDFATTPPNASVIDESNDTIAVVEITAAAWSAGTLTATVTVLEGALPVVGDEIGITIDAFPTAVNAQITDA